MMDSEKEIDIILQAQRGQKQAISDLYRLYVDAVYKFIFYRTGSREEAEDLTSETFIKMIKSIKNFSFDSKFKTWLLGIAKHTILDYFRKHYKTKTLPIEDYLNLDLGNLEIIFNEEIDKETIKNDKKVAKVLSRLPENYRDVLELRFLRGYSIKETAAELNKSISNVKVMQYRAIQKAQKMVNEF